MTIPGVNLVTYPLIKQAPSVNCSPLGATIKVASYRKRTLCTLVLIYVTVKYIYMITSKASLFLKLSANAQMLIRLDRTGIFG